jgi:predicted nucleotide-binding protein
MNDPLKQSNNRLEGSVTSTLQSIRTRLENAGLALTRSQRLPNETGHQLRFATGEVVNLFDTGTITIQGKHQERVRQLLGLKYAPANSRKVQKGGDPVTTS